MKNATVIVDVLYFTEDYDLVVDCPQLMVFGVVGGILAKKRLNEKLVIDCFRKKLKARIARFENQAAFMETMFLNGYWDITSEKLAPKPMEYFIENYSFVKRKFEIPNLKTASFTFEYTLEINESILQISNSINRIILEES